MARNKEFDQEQVLSKALEIFRSKGYNATSAQDLVDGLGISRSSLYDTFGDKRNLYLQSLNRYRNKSTQEVIDRVDGSNDVDQAIRDLFQFVVTDSIHNRASGCLMVNSSIEMAPVDKDVAEIVNFNMQDVEDSLTRAIRKGQDQGVYSTKHSARTFARFLFNTISGLRVASKSGADKKVFEDVVKVALWAIKA